MQTLAEGNLLAPVPSALQSFENSEKFKNLLLSLQEG
jgi:hypothetical protein